METTQISRRAILIDCVFCGLDQQRIVEETEWYLVVRDIFPVTNLHTLIIARRHVETYFSLSEDELKELPIVLQRQRDAIVELDEQVSGFNIGINVGGDAGQTISHCHIHLIPRRKGDVENPRGGVRGVIPERQDY